MKNYKSYCLVILFPSCKKDDLPILNVETGSFMKLGKKLKNPFTTKNMQIAFDSKSNNLKSSIILATTDYYVRFLPSTSQEFEILENDLALELFTHPLDYEVVEDGDYYLDPDFIGQDFQWFYTVVPVDFQFPNIEYEILDEACMYHSDRTNQFNEAFFDDLELESELLTGNITQEEYNSYKAAILRKKNVRGCITAADDVKTRVPLKGIKLRAQNFLKISYTYTNAQGCFVFPLKYKSAHVKAIATDVLNNKARGASTQFIFLDVLSNISHKLGNYSNSQIDNIQFNFPFGPASSVDRKKWVAFTVIDAFWDFNTISSSKFGIYEKIKNSHSWISNASGDFSAPCLNALKNDGSAFVSSATLGSISLAGTLNLFLPGASTMYVLLINSFLPDFFMSYSRQDPPHEYRQVIYHELSHFIEYKKTGVRYWEDYVNHIINNGGYGNGNQQHSGLVAIMESWAEDFSLSVADVYYASNSMIPFLSITPLLPIKSYAELNEFRRGCSINTNSQMSGFIRFGYYYDLQDELWANFSVETLLWTQNPPFPEGFRGHPEYFAGWTYRVQYQAFGSKVRSYQQHRDAMWQVQTPYTYAQYLNINNVLNYVVENHCTQTP